jgi:hypothetical protein
MKLLIPYRKLFAVLLFTGIVAAKAEQPILTQTADPSFKSSITTTGALSNQFSAFIVGSKPIAVGSISFAAINNGSAKKVSVGIYKGSINGTTATLQNRIALASADVASTNDGFKKFTATFSSDVLLDVYTVYYVLLHNENNSNEDLIVGLAASIGNIKSTTVTPMSGVFNQDVPVTGTNSGLIHKQAYLSVDVNAPAETQNLFSLQKFVAIPQRGKTLLQWKMENTASLSTCILEKSSNEVNYNEIFRQTRDLSEQPIFNFIDNNITGSKSFYRLKMVDKNGNTSYSKIASVENRSAIFTVNIQQTQLRRGESINLQVTASTNLNALFTIVNRYGQPVKQLNQQINSGTSSVKLSSADFAPGYYYLKCITNFGDVNEDIKMVVL